MLNPHQVIPFLQHEEPFVRNHATDYLAKAHDCSPATADDCWAAIDRFGMGNTYGPESQLDDFPQTAASLRRTLDALASAPTERSVYFLLETIAEVDFEVLEHHREEIFASERVPEPVKAHLRQRLELAGQPSAVLWERLMAHGHEVGEAYVGEFDHRISERLVEALGRSPGETCEQALAVLRDESIQDWREVFAVQLIESTRYEPAVPTLIETLGLDADFLLERAVDALTRIGTPDVVARLEAFIPDQEWGARLTASAPLERIKRPESEAALLRLLHNETAKDLRSMIATNLCMLCPGPEILEEVRDLLAAGRLEGWESDLQNAILAAGVMVGYEPPEARNWRRDLAHQHERTQKMLASDMLPEAFRDRMKRMGMDVAGPADAATDLFPEASTPTTAAFLQESRSRKVGRNEPCPCGSGRKYKKCCINRK